MSGTREEGGTCTRLGGRAADPTATGNPGSGMMRTHCPEKDPQRHVGSVVGAISGKDTPVFPGLLSRPGTTRDERA